MKNVTLADLQQLERQLTENALEPAGRSVAQMLRSRRNPSGIHSSQTDFKYLLEEYWRKQRAAAPGSPSRLPILAKDRTAAKPGSIAEYLLLSPKCGIEIFHWMEYIMTKHVVVFRQSQGGRMSSCTR
jgi:hypothetical protein